MPSNHQEQRNLRNKNESALQTQIIFASVEFGTSLYSLLINIIAMTNIFLNININHFEIIYNNI